MDGDVPVAEQLLLGILDTVREPMLVLDAQFRVKQANQAFYRAYPATPEDTIGKVLFKIDKGRWDIPLLRTVLEDKLPVDQPVRDCEIEHVFPDLGRRIMLVNARLLSQGPKVARVIVLTIEDMTELRLVETHLKDQRRELERSNEALDLYASVASHDLQEPLRKILSFGERLGTVAGPALTEESRELLGRMTGAATRMRTLIADLLAYSQVTARTRPFAATDLGKVAREVISDLETAIAEAGGRVDVGELPVIDADALQMRQLLQNLLSNSLRFRNKDQPLVVKLACSHNGGYHCSLTVTDNGIGFSEEYAEKIFKMFERLHGRMTYDGSGIGLAICRKIVERHGGTIAATSTVGKGATFTVTLPMKQATSAGQAS